MNIATLTTSLHIAERLLALGLSVIPIPRPRPGVPAGQPGDGKVPLLQWREYQTRLPTPAEVRRWFSHEPMNIAVITGTISNVVVIDADDREALRWAVKRFPYTPWQTETANGFHLWYRHPGGHVANRARIDTGAGKLKLDLRADGGFVICAGSRHASGAEYREAGDWTAPREQVPRFWPGWLARPTPRSLPRTPLVRPTGDVVIRARAYLVAIPPPMIGAGSDTATLSAACRLVRGFDLDASDAESLLWEWCGGRAGWTREWVARKVRHAGQYGSEMIGGLRDAN